jgi:alkylglycerol monooxygenase
MIKTFAYSIIVMMLLVLLELAVSRALKKKVFEFFDTLSNLACGILERTFFLLFAVLYYTSFKFMQDHFALFSIAINWWSVLVLFVAVDFLWYWYHRAGHEINILWAAHITHHQSEEYNLSLSFRVSAIQLIIRMFFWLWLPVIGFDPALTTLIIGINAAYQFFIHTRLIGKLGFLEKVLVTPSHHRVHHGKNEQYIDKNYGGIFIVWDKLFGTFTSEKEDVVYGITKPLNSKNPIKAWFHYYFDLIAAAKQVVGWRNKLRIMIAGPEIMAAYYDSLPKEKPLQVSNNGQLRYYLLLQFSLLCAVFFLLYYYYDVLPESSAIVSASFVIYSALSLGFVLDRNRFSFWLEALRLVCMSVCVLIVLYGMQVQYYIVLALVPVLLFLPWIGRRKALFGNVS